MRYAKVSCIEFYSCYLQQCLSIYLFSYRIPGHGQKGHMNKVCQSLSFEVFLELALSFVLELRFLKIMFCPKNGEKRPSLGFFECMGKFSFFSQFFNFFLIWSIMKVCIIVIAVCLNKFHIWKNSSS